jgi:hypothetical protein
MTVSTTELVPSRLRVTRRGYVETGKNLVGLEWENFVSIYGGPGQKSLD